MTTSDTNLSTSDAPQEQQPIRKFEISILQNLRTGHLSVLYNKVPKELLKANKVIQVYTVSDFNGKLATPCRTHIKGRTENGTKLFEGNGHSATYLERMIDALYNYDYPRGNLMIVRKHNRDLKYLVSSKIEKLHAEYDRLNESSKQNREIYVYLDLRNKKITILPEPTKRKSNRLTLFQTYKTYTPQIKATVINLIRSECGSNKGLFINYELLKQLDDLFEENCIKIRSEDKLVKGLSFITN